MGDDRGRANPESGFSLLELTTAMAVFLGSLAALSSASLATIELEEQNWEQSLARQGLRAIVHELQAADPATVFQSFNATDSDDPAGAVGNAFDVEGLQALPGTSVGLIEFPTAVGAPGRLTETEVLDLFGTTMDMNMDGDTTDSDVTGSWRILPVRLRLTWRGSAGSTRQLNAEMLLWRD